MDKESPKLNYILYTYKPDLPNYFDQTEIVELPGYFNQNEIIEELCRKNSCNENEIDIIEIFDNRELMNRYLTVHDLHYLI